MTKYTVTLTQAHLRYTTATVEVEARDHVHAALLTHRMTLDWVPHHGPEDLGHCDFEVTGPDGGSISWRED